MVELSHSLNCMFLWICFVSSACFPTHFCYLNVLQRFFFKSQVIATNKFNIGRCDDFVWVTKDELLEYFPEHADYLNKMIINWCTRFHNFVMWVRFPLSAFTFFCGPESLTFRVGNSIFSCDLLALGIILLHPHQCCGETSKDE